MRLFSEKDNLKNKKYHEKYKQLLDDHFFNERDVLEEWFDIFYDKDNKIINEFQTTFHSSFWELYLNAVLKDLEFTLLEKYSSPDFIVTNPYPIYIEAVTANIKYNGVEEKNRNLNDIMSMIVHPKLKSDYDEFLNEAIIRHSNSLKSKLKKYNNQYKQNIDVDAPFVIALGAYDQINYGAEYIYPMLALLYGFCYGSTSNCYSIKDYIKKNENTEIEIGLFRKREYQDISAVMYSSTCTMGKLTALSIEKNESSNFVLNLREYRDAPYYRLEHVTKDAPDILSDGLYIFHNPFAKIKLSLDVFDKKRIVQYYIEDNDLCYCGYDGHLMSHLSLPKVCFNIFYDRIVECIDAYNKIGPPGNRTF